MHIAPVVDRRYAAAPVASWWAQAPSLLQAGSGAAFAPRPHVPKAPATGGSGWVEFGRVKDRRLDEISGVVASRTQPGVLWVHNDSGDKARVFALAPDGAVIGEVKVNGADAKDWEDIAMGPGPAGSPAGTPWLYVGDIGDNHTWRDGVQVYRFPEPKAADGAVDAQRIDLRYGDGRAHNAEAMLVDPRTGDLLIVTKVSSAGGAQLFRATAADLATGTATLQPLGVVSTGPLVTGGDVSMDGSKVVLRTYEGAYAWQVHTGESVAEAMLRAPTRFEAPSSEAICFTPDASAWMSISEGSNVPIWREQVPAIPTVGSGPDFF
ncbi:MAG: hypothetical protein JWM98_1068 [Thermoleophilia bacterium]|nr:hypothetical protein [Thermoleophilia bacterium]